MLCWRPSAFDNMSSVKQLVKGDFRTGFSNKLASVRVDWADVGCHELFQYVVLSSELSGKVSEARASISKAQDPMRFGAGTATAK